jgi:hypothetical protein
VAGGARVHLLANAFSFDVFFLSLWNRADNFPGLYQRRFLVMRRFFFGCTPVENIYISLSVCAFDT